MKLSKTLVLALAAVLLLTATGAAFAQSSTPTAPAAPAQRGPGNGRAMHAAGVLHPYMVEAWAKELGLTTDAINQRLVAGETMRQIAESAGKTQAEFTALKETVRLSALDAALEDGAITQEQADFMRTHQPRRMRGPNGGGCHGPNGATPGTTTPNTQPQG